ncbi:MAG: hypothetical protein A3J24_02035 [Deltaproteobacteria bacterium RIFCSPLOWO2_02_FULL_53_8]|nr:MAG: hypothetical protein A3J24_02035 [Deltaproteobacteria bacterium RIFCSPLOWO2_02_FULL_53_8]
MSTIYDFLGIVHLINILTSIPMLIASIGLILVTSSFISGLQLVKTTAVTLEGKIHRLNGVISIVLYCILLIISVFQNGLTVNLLGWFFGLGVIALKITLIRKRRRRTFKYVNWLGGMLFIIWVYLVWAHLPV